MEQGSICQNAMFVQNFMYLLDIGLDLTSL
jgi:hypothetical protein